jgi:AcrR family transcriptional regulator
MLGRRERLRAATVLEITQTARRILVDQGPEAVTLRAIAREMGMTAPALYRYFGSHQDLLRHLIGELFNELTDALHTEIHKAEDMTGKFMAVSFGFRTWALAHKREYTLLFGSPFAALEEISRADFAEECARRLGLTFLNLFTELWTKHPFPIPADSEIDPAWSPSSSATGPEPNPRSPSAACSSSCSPGSGCRARSAWRSSAISTSPSTTRCRCSS